MSSAVQEGEREINTIDSSKSDNVHASKKEKYSSFYKIKLRDPSTRKLGINHSCCSCKYLELLQELWDSLFSAWKWDVCTVANRFYHRDIGSASSMTTIVFYHVYSKLTKAGNKDPMSAVWILKNWNGVMENIKKQKTYWKHFYACQSKCVENNKLRTLWRRRINW